MSSASSALTAPQLERSALITIDVQADVLDGRRLEIAGSSAALPQMCLIAEAFRARGLPIVHVVRLYRSDGSNVDLCRREAVINGWQALAPGSAGAELAPGLAGEAGVRLESERLLGGELQRVSEHEVVMYKPRWGAFYDTPLHAHLSDLGVSTLAFCGVNFPNCPRTSMYEASERDFRLVLATDAISGFYERGREELAGIGVNLMTAGELATALMRSAAGAGAHPTV